MSNEPSFEEIVANKTGVEPDQYYETLHTELNKSAPLRHYLIKHFKFSKLAKYWEWPHLYHKTLVNDLQLTSSFFLNQSGPVYPVSKIPSADVDDPDETTPKIARIFNEFPFN